MKVTKIKTFIVDGGFRPWTFVKIETDSGIVGWGDCTDWGSPTPIAKMVERLSEFVIGEDPLNTEYIWWKLYARCVRHAFGIAHKAMAGIDSALWDIRGKFFNAPVWQLLGGKLRDSIPVYWTHFGSTDLSFPEVVNRPPLRTPEDLAKLCEEAKQLQFSAVKTNVNVASVFGRNPSTEDFAYPYENYRHTIASVRILFEFLREHLGDDIGIALDVAFTYRLGGAMKLARALEEFDLMWLETESFHADTMKTIRESTTTPLCMGESLFGIDQYRPFLQSQAVDIVMPDLAWNGITMGKRIADLAHAYEILFAPHNCHSPLTTYISLQLCAHVPNFYLLELDYHDVPWRDEIVETPFEVKAGRIDVPTKPGLGSDLIEEKLLKYPPKQYTTR